MLLVLYLSRRFGSIFLPRGTQGAQGKLISALSIVILSKARQSSTTRYLLGDCRGLRPRNDKGAVKIIKPVPPVSPVVQYFFDHHWPTPKTSGIKKAPHKLRGFFWDLQITGIKLPGLCHLPLPWPFSAIHPSGTTPG
jgi:hypothetical protein